MFIRDGKLNRTCVTHQQSGEDLNKKHGQKPERDHFTKRAGSEDKKAQ